MNMMPLNRQSYTGVTSVRAMMLPAPQWSTATRVSPARDIVLFRGKPPSQHPIFTDADVKKAVAWAEKLHRVQKTADGSPYIIHPIRVAHLLAQHEGSKNEVMAGILHDVVEDQGGAATEKLLRKKFGDEIGNIVAEEASEDLSETNWKKRKQGYLDKISTISTSGAMVIAADKVDNVRFVVDGLKTYGWQYWDMLWPPENGTTRVWDQSRIDDMFWYYTTAQQQLQKRVADDPRLKPLVRKLRTGIGQLRMASMQEHPDVKRAFAWAQTLHASQKRADGGPYMVHLEGVARILMVHGATPNEVIAGILHDAVEDQGGASTDKEMRQRFSHSIADTVAEASEEMANTDWMKRKQAYLDNILTVSPSALMVIGADKLDNVRSTCAGLKSMGRGFWDGMWPPEENDGQPWDPAWIDDTLWFYQTAYTQLKARIPDEPRIKPIVTKLHRSLTQMEVLIGESKMVQ